MEHLCLKKRVEEKNIQTIVKNAGMMNVHTFNEGIPGHPEHDQSFPINDLEEAAMDNGFVGNEQRAAYPTEGIERNF